MNKQASMSLEALEDMVTPFLPMIFNKPARLNSRDRNRSLVEIRIIYVHLANQMNHYLPEVAQYLKKDRTVMLYYIKQFRNLIETDPLFRKKYQEITDHIQTYYPYEPSIVEHLDQTRHYAQPGLFPGLLPV
jgi:hypothetical protein